MKKICQNCHKKIKAFFHKKYHDNTIVKQEYYHEECWKELGKPLLQKASYQHFLRDRRLNLYRKSSII